MTTVGVTTLVSGRRGHLARHLQGLAGQSRPADRVVVVAMDDDPVNVVALPGVVIVRIPAVAGELPLAAARNAGVRALATEAVILLDVDCIPAAGLVQGYVAALADAAAVDGLVCGEVRYLPPGQPNAPELDDEALRRCSRPHSARPAPAPGELRREDLHPLAWTTSLALTRATFEAIGGFDERFYGYGGEDTDFAERARLAGVGVWWTGDATAFHQDHGVARGAPSHHLDAIIRNATLFARLHGWWPMSGWLEDFARQGLVSFDPVAGVLVKL